jgi:tRNA(Ile)-lysidine synthase
VSERVIAVAYSGGRDSTALLHATIAMAVKQGANIVALHVHHGLSEHADAWLDHCESQCRRWARAGRPVAFAAHRLTDRPSKGESVEAWARRARYGALRMMALAHGAELVLLGHHRRDQAETFVLQALRGGGVKGLAGMPREVHRDGITWARPWLDKPRAEIDAYVRRHRLKHIDDDSNDDPRFARNRLRLQVWPALAGAFPQAEATLAGASQWAHQAAVLQDEIAERDLLACADESGIAIEVWKALSPARRSNALRAWIERVHGSAAPASLITRLLEELPMRRSARWPLDGDELRAYRGRLRYAVVAPKPVIAPVLETHLSVRRAGRHGLTGWSGILQIDRVAEGGVPLAWLAHLELRPRIGGERFQAGIARPPRGLKKQYQDAGVPKWERDGPLVYSGGQLVFVPGLGLDARVIGLPGLPGQPLVSMRWLPG